VENAENVRFSIAVSKSWKSVAEIAMTIIFRCEEIFIGDRIFGNWIETDITRPDISSPLCDLSEG